MKLRLADWPSQSSLAIHGSSNADATEGVLFVPRAEIPDWETAEDELTEAFRLTRTAFIGGGPVIYLVDSRALLGRSAPLSCAVAAGLLGGARAAAFEGRRNDVFATVIAASADASPERVSDAVGCAVATGAGNGQVIALGDEHLGAMFP